jgi:hypothetical protein
MKMASTAQEEVYRSFLAASGQQPPAIEDANAMLQDVVEQLRKVANSEAMPTATKQTATISPQESAQQAAVIGDANAMLANVIAQLGEIRSSTSTQVTAAKTPTPTTPQDSGISVGSVASTVLKSGFGLAPLIGGLVNLFSSGGAETPAPLVKYAMPTAIDFQAAQSNGRLGDLDYEQTGMARTSAQGAGLNGSGATPQITVNVQAMDARSFLDRSNDIALAVRDAMLNMNAINDVINEL